MKGGLATAGNVQSEGPEVRDVRRGGRGFIAVECAVLGSDLCGRLALRTKNNQ